MAEDAKKPGPKAEEALGETAERTRVDKPTWPVSMYIYIYVTIYIYNTIYI